MKRVCVSRSNWNLEVLVFKEWGKPEYRKTSRSKGENQQQTQPTYGVDASIQTRATLVGGECSQEDPSPIALDYALAASAQMTLQSEHAVMN